MSTGYGWEGLRQAFATLLGVHHVPERLCSGLVYLRCAITNVRPLPLSSSLQQGSTKEMLNVKCNNNYSVQNDESLCGQCTVHVREESESGIRK